MLEIIDIVPVTYYPLIICFSTVSVVAIVISFLLFLFHGYTCKKCRVVELKETGSQNVSSYQELMQNKPDVTKVLVRNLPIFVDSEI